MFEYSLILFFIGWWWTLNLYEVSVSQPPGCMSIEQYEHKEIEETKNIMWHTISIDWCTRWLILPQYLSTKLDVRLESSTRVSFWWVIDPLDSPRPLFVRAIPPGGREQIKIVLVLIWKDVSNPIIVSIFNDVECSIIFNFTKHFSTVGQTWTAVL